MAATPFAASLVAEEQQYRQETTFVTDTKHGVDAARAIGELMRKNPIAAEYRRSVLARLNSQGASDMSSVVMNRIKRTRLVPVERDGLVGMIDRLVNDEVHAYDVVYDEWNGTIVTTPFEWDGDTTNTAEHNVWFIDADGFQIGQDVIAVMPPASYGEQVYSLGHDWGYDPYSGTYDDQTGTARGEGRYWRGVDCTDHPAIYRALNASTIDVMRSAWINLGAALIPCYGFSWGWPVCVGGVWWGSVAFGIIYDKVDLLRSCGWTER